jgi:hypothetical protein
MNPNITKRLSRDTSYKPPDNTYQSSLSDKDIAKKLEDYSRVKKSDIFTIPIGTHIRYFSINPKTGDVDGKGNSIAAATFAATIKKHVVKAPDEVVT